MVTGLLGRSAQQPQKNKQICRRLAVMAGYLAELKGFFDGSSDLLIVGGGDAVYGLGTVECLSVVLDRYQKSGSMEESHLVCAPHVIPGKFLTYGVLYSGGIVFRELRDRLFRPSPGKKRNGYLSGNVSRDRPGGEPSAGHSSSVWFRYAWNESGGRGMRSGDAPGHGA